MRSIFDLDKILATPPDQRIAIIDAFAELSRPFPVCSPVNIDLIHVIHVIASDNMRDMQMRADRATYMNKKNVWLVKELIRLQKLDVKSPAEERLCRFLKPNL